MKDTYGDLIRVGDYVAAATMSYKRSHLRVGMITKINEETRKVSIRDTKSGTGQIFVVNGARGMVIIDHPTL